MVGVSISAFVLSSTIFAMLLYVTFYLQDVLGYGPLLTAGLRFLPISILSFVISPIAGKLTLRIHSRYLLGLGLLLIALGCKLATHIQPDSTWKVLLPGFVVAGIGIGVTNPVVASATVSVVPPERRAGWRPVPPIHSTSRHRHGNCGPGGRFPESDPTSGHHSPGGHPGLAGRSSPGTGGAWPPRCRSRCTPSCSCTSIGGPARPPRCLPDRVYHHPRSPDDHCHDRVADRSSSGPRPRPST